MSTVGESTSLPALSAQDACWRRIGVHGDKSCPQLARYVHCRNCPTFTAAGQRLFDRPAPAAYLAEWSARLAAGEAPSAGVTHAFLVFRLGGEALALPADLLIEVTPPRPIHRIPHWPNRVLSGLVNVRGRLELCVSLQEVMGTPDAAGDDPVARHRLLVTEHSRARWVFSVDEVVGIRHVPASQLEPAPATNRGSSCIRGLFRRQEHGQDDDRRVGIIDADRLYRMIGEAVR